MILHLAEDSIFLDYVIEHFETVAPGNNKYLIHIPNKNYKLKHINNKEKVITSKWPSRHYMECLGDIDNYDFVVLHCLLNYKVDIVNRAPSNAKFLWMFWGA